MLEVSAKRIAEKLNDLCAKNQEKYRFIAMDIFDSEYDAMEEMYDSWIVKVAE